MESADWIGWTASAVLMATLVRQVVVQWRERSTEGVSGWMFIGQLAASVLFAVYSWMVGNWVFVVSNVFLVAVAVAGQLVYRRNVRLERGGG